jgi:hypothetical protein
MPKEPSAAEDLYSFVVEVNACYEDFLVEEGMYM